MEYSVEYLKACSKEIDFPYIFFWSNKGEGIGKHCCSQWYKSEFRDPATGFTFCCAEQYMMFRKAVLFRDFDTANDILGTEDPRIMQRLGRTVKNFNQRTWDLYKYEIVKDGNLMKFAQNPELQKWLLSTAGHVLAEASPYDGIWGIKMREFDKGITDPNNWNGENLLGFAIMEVRDILGGRDVVV